MRLNRLSSCAFVGLTLVASGCGGGGNHQPPTAGADMTTTSTPSSDLAPPPAHDLAAPDTGDLAGTTSPPPPADMTTKAPPDLATGSTPPPPPVSPDMSTSAPPKTPTFAADVLPILENNGCFGSCHMSSVWNGVVADANNASALVTYLTTTKSSQCSTLDLVTTNDAANSYLYEKISGTFPNAKCQSDPMPEGNGPLPTSQSDIVKAWINAGALDN
ncbi:MAG TPA: hypothetical protein VIA18_02070 [Polyangia bacterium]|nr:hypothetical protein [Polyangia bacterium]